MNNHKYTLINNKHKLSFRKVSKGEKISCIIFTIFGAGIPLSLNFIRNTCFSNGYYECCGEKYNTQVCKCDY